MRANTSFVSEMENERCSAKVIAMHRPTHDPKLEETREYPFAWHFEGRKRLWEIRIQMRFKTLPRGRLHFGIELDNYVHVSGMAKQVQKMVTSSIRSVLGCNIYHSVGDDPATTTGEVEAPTFVMPLWSFDQFVESKLGDEPDILGSLEGIGMRRTDGLAAYLKAMQITMDNLSTDRVYTFCIWGISQFLDCMSWELRVPQLFGARMDFNKLCGSAPVFVGMYELKGTSDKDQRHLASRKQYYIHVAMWSEQQPPKTSTLQAMGLAAETARGLGQAESKEDHRTGLNKAAGGSGRAVEGGCVKCWSALCKPLM
mmetsp:Transcript_16336/g.30028  ORF Transcript_16336/g.30028 Transcript_16336/m.30028 type:complete len:313 (+) Transcript_16336:1-939(+)